ncbi:MAG: hypothetical protein ACI4W1_00180 [Ruminococcus sp.]
MNDKKTRIELRVTQSEKKKIAKLAESCRLCDEVADKVSPETEGFLLDLVDDIQRQLLLPEKSIPKQICQEVATWQQPASGPSRDG